MKKSFALVVAILMICSMSIAQGQGKDNKRENRRLKLRKWNKKRK
jgi:hypothetical protein